MKIYFNREPVVGPWGGGSKVLGAIVGAAVQAGHTVTFNREPYIDVIFCMDPRPGNPGLPYNELVKIGAPIVQRVGDLGTHGKPELTELLKQTIPLSRHVVFPSQWARDSMGLGGTVIPNAPVSQFYLGRTNRVTVSSPIRVVTHHWSNNPKKGFDIYKRFSSSAALFGIEFTFIGRSDGSIPSAGVMDIKQLTYELPKHDIYLTASEAEAGANHVLEAQACGLPVVYRTNGGSIPEYCFSGQAFESHDDLLPAVLNVASRYEMFKSLVMRYHNTMDQQARKYVEIFESVA
jgi:hypothetical protein